MFSFSHQFLLQINRLILVMLLIFILVMSFYEADVLCGSILSAFFFLMVYCYCIHINKKHDYALLLLMQLLVFFRVGLAYYDAQISVLPGMDKDPIIFYAESLHYLNNGNEFFFMNGSASFRVFLSYVYSVLGENRFSGNIISVVVSSLALMLFYECLCLLQVRYKKTTLFIFAVHASFVLYSVVAMREAYLTMFVLLFVYLSLLALLSNKKNVVYFFLALLSLLLWPVFHVKAFYLYGIFAFIVFSVVFVLLKRVDLKAQKKQIIITLIIMLPLVFLFKGDEFTRIVKGESPYHASASASDGSIMFGLDLYLSRSQTGRGEIRTKFKTVLDTSSLSTLVRTAPISFYYYMTEPMPWNYRDDLRDLMPMAESLFRVIALLLIGFYLIRTLFFLIQSKRDKKLVINNVLLFYLFFLYGAQCVIWSLGTANYGQSFRHHVPSLPLLLICLSVVVTHFFRRDEHLSLASSEIEN